MLQCDPRLIHEFSDLNAFLMLKTSVLLDEGEGAWQYAQLIFQAPPVWGCSFCQRRNG